jgi:protocatechuate 3,4-dioxygenase alpha subunit
MTLDASADNLNEELFGQTPSQTVGPFFHYGLPWKGGADLVGASDLGARRDLFPPEHDVLATTQSAGLPSGDIIEIAGHVLDGEGQPVPDAMIEIWQANAKGRYCSPDDARQELEIDPAFVGFGRCATGADGTYLFRTIRPGRVPGPGNTLQAPHIALSIFGRGLLNRLATRLYFDDGEGNEIDPVLSQVPQDRRHTLIAKRSGNRWVLDILLSGSNETVFLDI